MPSFAYSAINSQGNTLTGEIQATDLASARDTLRGDGLLAQWIEERRSGAAAEKAAKSKGSFGRAKKPKAKSLQIFSRQFATMIEAGLSVVSALVILEQQTEDEALEVVIVDVRERVEGGALLSEAMVEHPAAFNRLYVSMVEAGEAAGVLDVVLDRVATQIEKEQKIKRRVKGAMIYPTVVLGFATLVLCGMLMFLVPVFVSIFSTLGGELPMLTQWVVKASNALRSYWFIIFPIWGLGIWAFFRWKKTDKGRQSWDTFKLRVPMGIGQVVQQDRDGPLVTHALDARRVGCRHRQGPRDHRSDRRQLGRRGCDDGDADPRPGRRHDRAAARRVARVPGDGLADGQDR